MTDKPLQPTRSGVAHLLAGQLLPQAGNRVPEKVDISSSCRRQQERFADRVLGREELLCLRE